MRLGTAPITAHRAQRLAVALIVLAGSAGLRATTSAPAGATAGVGTATVAGAPRAEAHTGTEFRLVRTVDGHLVVQRQALPAGPRGGAAATATATASSGGWEPDAPVRAQTDPDEPLQWGLGASGFPQAWPTTTGQGVIVAVVDTGVRKTHEDLAGNVLPGTDFVAPGGDGSNDQNGHGTHVAGIIAALRNGKGGVGGAPSVKILPVRVLDASGSGYTSDVAQGIVWAADHGARVINLSLGGPSPAAAMQQAIQYANSKNASVVVAAGNNGQAGNPVMYPAAYPEAISVGAVDSNYQHASFSETGSYVDLSAPGVNILSTWGTSDNAYAWATGTSMATPFVSAAAALVLSQTPSLSPPQLAARLEATAKDLGAPGTDPVYGYGLVEPSSALVHTAGTQGAGYWVVGANGRVVGLGGAHFYGDLSHSFVFSPTVAAARTTTGHGYWLATADGHVAAFGDAHNYGDAHTVHLNGGIVAMAATVTGRGYWLMGSDGGVFSYGDARFYGSTGGMHLNAPALDLAPTANGKGYWFVAADGGVFCFGNASFHGSTGGMQLWQPVTSMTAATSGSGYWLVARDGGIFTFSVPFRGSLAPSASPGVRIRALPNSAGYYILTADGNVHSYSAAKWYGSASGMIGAPAVDLMLAG